MSLNQPLKNRKFFEVDHPLVSHKLSLLREVGTNNKLFRELVNEITILLAYEATKNMAMTTRSVTTPLETFTAPTLAGKDPVVLPILRAGIGMLDGFLMLLPTASVGHIGLFRDKKTLAPQQYYFKIPPDSAERAFFVCDPMLATGGSAINTVNRLKEAGVRDITFVCIVAAPEGVEKLATQHPDVTIYAASLDRELNDHAYILPGLGDAGDRLYGTK